MSMEPIKNYKGAIVCKGDPATGEIESFYKHSREITVLDIGRQFTIERQGVRTIITRTSDTTRFDVTSYDIAV